MNGLFGLNGLLGYAIAVVLLLTIVFIFGSNAVATQAKHAENYYKIEKPEQIKMISQDNVKHVVNAK